MNYLKFSSLKQQWIFIACGSRIQAWAILGSSGSSRSWGCRQEVSRSWRRPKAWLQLGRPTYGCPLPIAGASCLVGLSILLSVCRTCWLSSPGWGVQESNQKPHALYDLISEVTFCPLHHMLFLRNESLVQPSPKGWKLGFFLWKEESLRICRRFETTITS